MPKPVRRALTLLPLMLASLVLAAPSALAATCTFDAMTGTVTVDVGNGESVTIARSGDAIALDGAPCDTATVTNSDTIAVAATGVPGVITIALGGGAFAPGLTPETEAGPEIEFVLTLAGGAPTVQILGSAGPDHVVVGALGINLDATEPVGDPDVTMTGGPALSVDGAGGNDTLSVAGGAGTGAPSAGAGLAGGGGDDLLLGAAGGSTLSGGDGADTADYTGATQVVLADLVAGAVTLTSGTDSLLGVENLIGSPGADTIRGDAGPNVLRGVGDNDEISGGPGDDTLDGGLGTDTVDYAAAPNAIVATLTTPATALGDGIDALDGFENLIGTPFDDVITGSGDANVIDGGDGDDQIEGGAGDDDLIGGAGSDSVDFHTSGQGVNVDLEAGTASGDGADTLSGFENVRGSPHDDTIHGTAGPNRLRGNQGADTIAAHDGNDTLRGGDGNDLLFGQFGGDEVFGGPGRDELDGGGGDDRCKGGPDPDAYLFCENHPTVK